MYYVADHHEAIISKEDFEAAGLLITQRAAEKGIKRESQIYQQRYAFSVKSSAMNVVIPLEEECTPAPTANT